LKLFKSQAAVAQLVEHVIRNDGVVGSSPISGTILLFEDKKPPNTLKGKVVFGVL
jgi:hypothetical protein